MMIKKLFSIFSHFFYLGCISFGGPAAHLSYFQRYFIEKHQWLDIPTYSRMVALSQFLPGPASSQVGFSIGYHRAGLAGAIMAFVGFTLPSFILLYTLAIANHYVADSSIIIGVIYGLKLMAVVIVGDAIISMAKVFCKNKITKIIALITMLTAIASIPLGWQLMVLFGSGVIGVYTIQQAQYTQQVSEISFFNTIKKSFTKRHYLALALFCTLFISAFFINVDHTLMVLFAEFYQAGSLVFGGGHVVLPMLQQTVSLPIDNDTFIVGYSAAQAVPGPMFTIATFLGANLLQESPLLGALIATIAIFLPGFLLLLTLQNVWQVLAYHPKVSSFVMGVNASVVGLLSAAFYHPVAQNAIFSIYDVLWVVLGFILLRIYRLPVLAIVAFFIAVGVFSHL